MTMRVSLGLAGCAWLLGQAFLHGGHDENVVIIVNGDTLSVTTSIQGQTLTAFDSNADGVLSVGEFRSQTDAINDHIDQHLAPLDEQGLGIAPSFRDVPVEGINALSEEKPVEHIRIVRRYDIHDRTLSGLKVALFTDEAKERRYILVRRTGQTKGTVGPAPQIIPLP